MVENRFKFNGQQYDPISQQYYLRARYYNPVIARFTQEDTYHGDGLNLYAYCRNNPVYYVDPSGHSCGKDANDKHSNDGQESGVPLLPAPEPILALPGPVMEPPIINPMQEMQRAKRLQELSAPEAVLALPGPVLDNYANRTNGPEAEVPNSNNREKSGSGSGIVEYMAPPGATPQQIAQVKAYVDGCNDALAAGKISSTGRVSTKGTLRRQASREAKKEAQRAMNAGTPYTGHVGHVPDTTWTNSPVPFLGLIWIQL